MNTENKKPHLIEKIDAERVKEAIKKMYIDMCEKVYSLDKYACKDKTKAKYINAGLNPDTLRECCLCLRRKPITYFSLSSDPSKKYNVCRNCWIIDKEASYKAQEEYDDSH